MLCAEFAVKHSKPPLLLTVCWNIQPDFSTWQSANISRSHSYRGTVIYWEYSVSCFKCIRLPRDYFIVIQLGKFIITNRGRRTISMSHKPKYIFTKVNEWHIKCGSVELYLWICWLWLLHLLRFALSRLVYCIRRLVRASETRRDVENSHKRQFVPKTSRTQDN